MLGRLLRWAETVAHLGVLVGGVGDRRVRPRIATAVVLRAVVLLFVTRLGSLNALEQTRRTGGWRRWLAADLPSADSLGRIVSLVELEGLRLALRGLYQTLKRGKALGATSHGLFALVLDGHESHASYRRHCAGCLQRRVQTRHGWRTQYFHQAVMAMLLCRPFPLILDVEPLRAGEGEIEAALRLLRRLLAHYPRAFDVCIADALYSDARIYELLLEHHKDVLSVLKRNAAEVMADAVPLLDQLVEPQRLERPRGDAIVAEVSVPWTAIGRPVRVVRSREQTRVRRQLDGEVETVLSEWLWMTTLSPNRAVTAAVLELGHARWLIENRGFNETANQWHADHIYRHDANAIVAFTLLAAMTYNLFHAFWHRSLPAKLRLSYQHVAACCAADLYQTAVATAGRSP